MPPESALSPHWALARATIHLSRDSLVGQQIAVSTLFRSSDRSKSPLLQHDHGFHLEQHGVDREHPRSPGNTEQDLVRSRCHGCGSERRDMIALELCNGRHPHPGKLRPLGRRQGRRTAASYTSQRTTTRQSNALVCCWIMIGMAPSGKVSTSCSTASRRDNERLLAMGAATASPPWFICWILDATFGRRLPLQAGLVALPFHHRA